MSSEAACIALYQHMLDEVKELRNERWRLAIYFTSVSAAMIALLKDETLLAEYMYWFAIVGILVQSFSLVIFPWLVLRNHKYLTRTRNIRRSLEASLGLHAIEDAQGNPILPSQWALTPVSGLFEAIDVTIPIVLFTIVCQVASIVLLLSAACS